MKLIVITLFTILSIGSTRCDMLGLYRTSERIIFINGVKGLKTIKMNLSGNYILAGELILTKDWEAIGTQDNPFTGTFDGRGNKIIGLKTSDGNTNRYNGLFGRLGSTAIIQNIIVENPVIVGVKYVGVIAGSNQGIIENVTVENADVEAKNGNRWATGGIVGVNTTRGTIRNSSANGKVIGEDATAGIVGYNNGLIEDSNFSGSVTGTNSVGGIAGVNRNNGIISNSSFTGGEVGGNKKIGGLVGDNENVIENSYTEVDMVNGEESVGGFAGYNGTGTIKYSYSRGNVVGTFHVGGFVGHNASIITDTYTTASIITQPYATTQTSSNNNNPAYHAAGGFVGYNNSAGNITNSYATGTIITKTTGSNYMGCFIGRNEGDITASYFDNTTTTLNAAGMGDDNGISEYNKDGNSPVINNLDGQPITPEDFSDWLFPNNWTWVNNAEWPQLAWE